MANGLILRHKSYVDNSQIGRFEAVFPKTIQDLPKFIKLIAADKSAVLKVSKRNVQGAIFVSESTLKGIQDDSPVEYVNSSFLKFNWYKLHHDNAQLIAFICLLLAIIGTAIEGSFAIGKSGNVLIPLNENEITFYLSLSLWLKIIGLLGVFIKSLLDAK
jgi:hypothetical protein